MCHTRAYRLPLKFSCFTAFYKLIKAVVNFRSSTGFVVEYRTLKFSNYFFSKCCTTTGRSETKHVIDTEHIPCIHSKRTVCEIIETAPRQHSADPPSTVAPARTNRQEESEHMPGRDGTKATPGQHIGIRSTPSESITVTITKFTYVPLM